MALGVLLFVLFLGLFKVTVNGDPSQLVASDSARYDAFAERLENFPSDQRQLLVFTESAVLSHEHLTRYEQAARSLTDLPEVMFVGSLFSPPTLANALRQIIKEPDASIENGVVDDVAALLKQPDYLASRMVSAKLDAAQMSITLKSTESIEHTIASVTAVLEDAYPKESGIRWSLAGNPIVEHALERDVLQELLRVTLISALFGSLVAAWVVRRAKSILILLSVPTAAVIGTVGLMGWLGMALTLLSQAVLIVVFLVVFTDTLHALRSTRSQSSLMLACGLTSLTTGAAAIALWFASSVVIQDFAVSLLAGIAVGFCVWVLWLIAWGAPRNDRKPYEQVVYAHQHPASQKRRADQPSWPIEGAVSDPKRWVLAGVSLCVLVLLGAQLRTGFSLTENLPRTHDVASALTLAEDRFSGYLPLQVVVSARDANLEINAFVVQVAQLQSALNDMANTAVNSAADATIDSDSTGAALRWYSLIDVLALTPGDSYEQQLGFLPAPLLETLWRPGNEVVLFAPKSLTEWLQTPEDTIETLDRSVQELAAKFQLQVGPVTGMPVLVHEASDALLGDAWRSVLLTVFVLGVLVLVVLKSVSLAGLAALPVVFGLAGYTAALVLLGEPLRHAGVVMMTIVIGLSVDNALHLIVSAQSERLRKIPAMDECLSVLQVATMVIIAGFIALAFSDIPSLAMLGFAASVALAIGFFAAAFWLPPMLLKRF